MIKIEKTLKYPRSKLLLFYFSFCTTDFNYFFKIYYSQKKDIKFANEDKMSTKMTSAP